MIDTQNFLVQAMDQALETMAFLTVIPDEENMIVPEKTILAEMSFSGPRNGTIQILAGTDFAEVIAENIGAMDQVNDEMRFDALKELSNVTCGLLIPMIASTESDVFDLTVPVVKASDDAPNWQEFIMQQNACIVNVDGFGVATRLILSEQQT